MDATTQFYITLTEQILSYNPNATAAVDGAVGALSTIGLNGVLSGAPTPGVYARYCAIKFIFDTLQPQFDQLGQFIGVDNPSPPPPTLGRAQP